jgi:hypothetical protein
MCLHEITKYHQKYGYKVGQIEGGRFRAFVNATRQFDGTMVGVWQSANIVEDIEREVIYPAGFHILPNFKIAKEYMKELKELCKTGSALYDFDQWVIIPCIYRGVICEGLDDGDTPVVIASQIYIYDMPQGVTKPHKYLP